jgi:hypothetical protein
VWLAASVGAAAGLAFAAGNLWIWWKLIRAASAPSAGSRAVRSAVLIVVLFLLKLPAFVLLATWIHSLPAPAEKGFLVGLGMVYFALVGWALARR